MAQFLHCFNALGEKLQVTYELGAMLMLAVFADLGRPA